MHSFLQGKQIQKVMSTIFLIVFQVIILPQKQVLTLFYSLYYFFNLLHWDQ